jgi:hypothetical protein
MAQYKIEFLIKGENDISTVVSGDIVLLVGAMGTIEKIEESGEPTELTVPTEPTEPQSEDLTLFPS